MNLLGQQDEFNGVLGQGTRFDGKLVFEGQLRIEGQFLGKIYTRDNLIISKTAQIRADIEADEVLVAGVVEGSITAHNKITITKEGFVKGSVSAPSIKIEEGGVVEGTTQMTNKTP